MSVVEHTFMSEYTSRSVTSAPLSPHDYRHGKLSGRFEPIVAPNCFLDDIDESHYRELAESMHANVFDYDCGLLMALFSVSASSPGAVIFCSIEKGA